MNLRDHIREVQEGIREQHFVNEASVSQGIVLRLLQALGWPTYDTKIVTPEFSVSNRRVDFALCHPREKPLVFVEVKQVGQTEGAERQLFEYAFHRGVPMAVLTDGQEWHFFLPGEQGHYQERRVYKLDLLERDIEEIIRYLQRYLAYHAICNGTAIQNARRDYEHVSRERQIRANLPTAWRKIIEERDPSLMDLLADKVESLCGYRPDEDTLNAFLAQVAKQPLPKIINFPENPGNGSVTPPIKPPPPIKAGYGFTFQNQFHPTKNAISTLIELFEFLSQYDSNFLANFAALPKHGRTRRYLADTPEKLYPSRPDMVGKSHQLSSGWWVGTNYGKRSIRKIAKMACEVVGLKLGKDIILSLDKPTSKK